MLAADVIKLFCDCSKMALVYYNAKFKFQNIVSNKTPAPRFNTATTNISEQIGSIMKSNGAQFNKIDFVFKNSNLAIQ